MYVCICNPFNDKAVDSLLGDAAVAGRAVKIADVYRACSGGRKPECGTCCRTTLKEMVDGHNSRIRDPGTVPKPGG